MTAHLPEDAEDAQCMNELARGDDLALNALMRRWSARIFSYLERCCGDATTATDLTQETFVRVYKNRLSYDPSRRFSTWLYTIATNLARNHSRWQKRHPLTLLDHETLQETAPACDAPGPADSLHGKERAEAVRRAVEALPEELREPLLLSTYEHLPHVQIGTILGLTEKAVEMRLYRARQALRVSLRHLLPDTPAPSDEGQARPSRAGEQASGLIAPALAAALRPS